MFLQPVIERSLVMKKRTQSVGGWKVFPHEKVDHRWSRRGGIGDWNLDRLGKGRFQFPDEKESAPSPSADIATTKRCCGRIGNQHRWGRLGRHGEGRGGQQVSLAFFSTNNNDQTVAMKKVFDEATAKVADPP